MSAAIFWFGRDLRMGDNPAWPMGTRHSRLVPLFVIDPGPSTGSARSAARCSSLISLLWIAAFKSGAAGRGWRKVIPGSWCPESPRCCK